MKATLQGLKILFSGASLVALLGFGTLLSAQAIPEQEVPQKVKAAFEKNQSHATATWRKGPKAMFEACFERSGEKQVYAFGKNGGLLLKMIEISPILLPSSINTQIASEYPFSKLTLAYRVMTPSKKKFYEVEIESLDLVQRLRFSTAGKQIGAPLLLRSKVVVEESIASSVQTIEVDRGDQEQSSEEETVPVPEEVQEGLPAEVAESPLPGVVEEAVPEEDLEAPFPENDLDLIDEDIRDLFEDDPLYNEEAGYDVIEEDDFNEEDWEDLWEEEEDDADLLKELEEMEEFPDSEPEDQKVKEDEEDNPKG